MGFRKARSVDRFSIRRVAALTKGSSISCTSGRSLPTSSLDVLGQEGWCTAEKQWSLILNGWREETLENRGADLALWSPPSRRGTWFSAFSFSYDVPGTVRQVHSGSCSICNADEIIMML